jgi:nucleotide-binding universal stress UspA family protein
LTSRTGRDSLGAAEHSPIASIGRCGLDPVRHQVFEIELQGGSGGTVKTISKILCAVDLTKASRNAFDRALSVARVSEAKLYILHAVPANERFSWRQSERLEHLTRLRRRAEAAGIAVRVDEQHGDPARVIVLHADARKIDLVVLGSNRRRGWQRFRQGSVGERVLRRASWSVLIVPWDAGAHRHSQASRAPSRSSRDK